MVIQWDSSTGFTGIDAATIAQWQVAYPAIDVPTVVAQASAWLAANPANRKKNNARFLVNWLKREQDHAPRHNGSKAPQTAPATTHPAVALVADLFPQSNWNAAQRQAMTDDIARLGTPEWRAIAIVKAYYHKHKTAWPVYADLYADLKADAAWRSTAKT